MKIAPIALFVYNRPIHTQKVLDALKLCEDFDKTEVHIFSDGPRNEQSRSNVESVRRILNELTGDNINLHFKKSNFGLAKSIVEGINQILSQFERIIVLEDDIVVRPGFLKFMNNALEFYADKKKVMHISGYMLPFKQTLPETFFFNNASCWGWGTWKDRWVLFEDDQSQLLQKLKKNKALRHSFNMNGAMNYFEQLNANAAGDLNTWAIKWYATIFNNHGLALHPGKSLTENIGLVGEGEHSNYFQFEQNNLTDFIEVKPIPLEEHRQVRKWLKTFMKESTAGGIINKLKKLVSRLIQI